MAISAARNAARTSPSQIAIACSTAASKGSGASDAGSTLTLPGAAAARLDAASRVITLAKHPQDVDSPAPPESGAGAPVIIEITPAMFEAGVEALRLHYWEAGQAYEVAERALQTALEAIFRVASVEVRRGAPT